MRKRINSGLVIVAIILIIFSVFYVLKINGYFDFSSNYNIKRIIASRDQDFTQSMIDGEEETVWGDPVIWEEPLADPGDYIYIEFVKKRKISSIYMSGMIPEDIHFYYTEGSVEKEISYNKNGRVYSFDKRIMSNNIKIVLGANSSDNRWVIQELKVYE